MIFNANPLPSRVNADRSRWKDWKAHYSLTSGRHRMRDGYMEPQNDIPSRGTAMINGCVRSFKILERLFPRVWLAIIHNIGNARSTLGVCRVAVAEVLENLDEQGNTNKEPRTSADEM